ncbi:MAG TPA: hypothetical protein PLD58_24065 [Phycisphaerae bacterium]|nr:hypothetical protein [Phycisphaerae bacterium]
MACLSDERRVPSSPDARLDELAEILARAMIRMVTKKSGSSRENALELSSGTRLSVTTSETRKDSEVT